jgi:hypothetical protein
LLRPTAFGWQPWDAAANIMDQRAVAASTIEVLRTESSWRRLLAPQSREPDGSGGFYP